MSGARSGTRRIAGVFSTRVVQFGLGFVVSFLLARLLGPEGRGTYYLIVLTPAALLALGQFGLPSAVTFFAGRGHASSSLARASLRITTVLSIGLIGIGLLLLPVIAQSILDGAPLTLVQIALLAIPFQLAAAFGGGILIGRQVLRNYNLILIGQSAAVLCLVVVLVGVLGWGVAGAVVANIAVTLGGAVAVWLEVRRATRGEAAAPPAHVGSLVGYGLRLYPASVASFFGYRIDVFLLGWIAGDPALVGLYSVAVSLAELAFFVPDAINTVFYPRVVGASRPSASDMAPQVTRLTTVMTSLVVLLLIPAAFVLVGLLLPEFLPSLPAFLVLLPGILAITIAKTLSSYISGLAMPQLVGGAAVVGLSVNVVFNIVLIPEFGILGAAASSTVSYTVHMVVLLVIATRLAGRPAASFLVPRRMDIERLRSGLLTLLPRRPANP